MPGSSGGVLSQKEIITIACSDMNTAILAQNSVSYFRAAASFVLTAVYASLFVASSSGLVTLDLNRNGATIFPVTKLSLGAGVKWSLSGGILPGIVTTTINIGDEFSIDIDAAGTGAKGLLVYVLGNLS